MIFYGWGMLKLSNPKKQSIKQILAGLGLALSGVFAALFLLEIGARWLPPPYEADTGQIFSCHPTLGWTGAPNFAGVVEDPNFRQQVTFNSLGMHDTEHTTVKPPGTFRILMLGDSFVQAVQVSEAETSHQVLENLLNQQGQSHFEVLSGGVVNWGTNQQLIYYRKQGRQFQPDLVLLLFYIGNDFLDNLPGNAMTAGGFNCYAPYFVMCQGRLQPEPLAYAPGLSSLENSCSSGRLALTNSLGRLFQKSRLYQHIEPLIVARQPRQIFGQRYPSSFSALYFPSGETKLEQAWQVTEATLIQLRREVEADGARFAVVLVSPEIVVRLGMLPPAEQQAVLNANPVLAQAQADRPNRRLAEFLARQHIPFIDLTPLMTKHLAAHQTPLYLLGEGHWTAEGNRVAAHILAGWLRQNNHFESR